MKSITLIIKSLRYYWRTNLGIFMGTVLSTAILVGALIVGDSVRYSLQQMALRRLGNTWFALNSGDRFFRAQLANDMALDLNTPIAPVLQLKGIAVKEGGELRVNQIVVNGIDSRFWETGGLEQPIEISSGEVVVNEQFARKLGIGVGDDFLLKVEKVDILPQDAPLALEDNTTVSFWVKVKKIVNDAEFGRFSLQTNQVPPPAVFIPLDVLAPQMELSQKANILLVGNDAQQSITLKKLRDSLKRNTTLADASLALLSLNSESAFELISDRIFMDSPVVDAVQRTDLNYTGIFTYFVNNLKVGKLSTPYSFVSAPGQPIVPDEMPDNGIIINQWLADDLRATPGDSVALTYYALLPRRQLEEHTEKFIIRKIVPMQAPYLDKALMPNFPGLSDAESCQEWDPGIPINLDLIRSNDEKYWENYRGAPKAFITLKKAQEMWSNRFGNLTAFRFKAKEKKTISQKILANLEPGSIGLQFQPVREEALKSSSEAVDFGQLFIGLSFFIIVAAIFLTALLFILSLEQRSNETGILLAVGFPAPKVKQLMLTEGAFLAILAAIVGAFAAIAYNKIVLYALGTVWKGATGTSALEIHLVWESVIIGVLVSVLIAILAIWLAARQQTRRTINELQQSGVAWGHFSVKWKTVNWIIIILSFINVAAIFISYNPNSGQGVAGAFFGAGALLLVGGLSLSYLIIGKVSHHSSSKKLSLGNLGIRNLSRRIGRSLAVIGLLACGIFLVVSVGANRFDPTIGTERRASGTGGFAFWGETVLPVVTDLNQTDEQEKYRLLPEDSVQFVPFRVQQGDDASCLNLNRVLKPQILGVQPEELVRRNAFSFAKTDEIITNENTWQALNQPPGENVIPAIADQTVIVWGLGKAVGDTLFYQDEYGQTIKLRLIAGLANSVFQGNVIISEENFVKHFPSVSGYRTFLIDVPQNKRKEVSQKLNQRMQDYGLDLTLAATRLAEFNVVTETYLRIFLALGGLGLLLGSIGLGIIVFRNTIERRGELALLRAVGYSVQKVKRLVFAEHIFLLLGGIVFGTLAALVSISPAIFSSGTSVPYLSLIILIIILGLWGLFWIWFSTRFAMKGALLEALREE